MFVYVLGASSGFEMIPHIGMYVCLNLELFLPSRAHVDQA
jgi:hypothetical protein